LKDPVWSHVEKGEWWYFRERERQRFLQSEETDYYTPRRDGGVAILDKRELRLHITRLPVMTSTART